MVTTITVNPAVDKTYIVDEFKPWEKNHAGRIIYNAGSKGINVSRVLKQLGLDTVVLGYVGGRNGEVLLRELNAEGIDEKLIRVEGETRLNVKIMDIKNNKTTGLNEMGFPVKKADIDKLFEIYKEQLKLSEAIVISGSILPEMPKNLYHRLILLAKNENKPVFIDCEGELLKETFSASPTCVKINKAEFEEILKRKLEDEIDIVNTCKKYIEKYNIECFIITLSAEGSIGVTKDKAVRILPPNVEVASTVGAGDAYLAGIVHGYLKNFDLKQCMLLATSYSNAQITKEGNNVPSMIELIGYIDGCFADDITI